MNFQWNIETVILVSSTVLALAGAVWIMKFNWKRYGLLFLFSAIVGQIICYLFVKLGFYSFPYRLFPHVSTMSFTSILTVFPFYVLFAVRYSPKPWKWKIPFYWALVHLGLLIETWAQAKTDLIQYDRFWDVWDSYTWWWIYLLVFEWIGDLLIPDEDRSPINAEWMEYGKGGWFILHFILILTVFLGGYYVGVVSTR